LKSERKDQIVSAILLGYSGSGKTSLYNNLCDTKEAVGFARENLTPTMTAADCYHLQKGSLVIYDTPGAV
jgi:putative ribosome biogenesis GTPase RsgA